MGKKHPYDGLGDDEIAVERAVAAQDARMGDAEVGALADTDGEDDE